MACCAERRHELEDGGGVGIFGGVWDGTSKRLAEAAANSSQVAKQLIAGKLDVDILSKSFGRFAGADEVMDAEE